MEERIQKAVDYFMQGYNCCESVVMAFADIYGMDARTAQMVSAGFGGGVGRMRMMCGAVSGMVILAGLHCGQTEPTSREGKAECYKAVRELVEEFKRANGSVTCAELLAMNGCKAAKDTAVPDERNAEYYKVRPCARKVESAARIFAGFIERNK